MISSEELHSMYDYIVTWSDINQIMACYLFFCTVSFFCA